MIILFCLNVYALAHYIVNVAHKRTVGQKVELAVDDVGVVTYGRTCLCLTWVDFVHL